jgi:hypothetical protein
MFTRFTYLILFLSLSGLLFANEQKIASLSLKPSKGIRTTASKEKSLPPSADDFITIDFRTDYCFVRALHNEQDGHGHISIYDYQFLKKNALSSLFVQKTVNFFESQSIYLLNCIWLI